MKNKILIIDDDEKLTKLLEKFLQDFGFLTFSAHTPSQGLKLLPRIEPDLVILDVMLPEMDGFEVCKNIRQKSTVPIIMLTARGELTDKVVGLELGSDDYLAKPFEPRELVARINTILRRTKSQYRQSSTFDQLKIDYTRQKALLAGKDIGLSNSEFSVLILLASVPGKVFDRDEILQQLRGIDSDAFNRTVDIAVSRLRNKLGDDPKDPQFIKTIWGSGYAFIGQQQ